MNASQALAGGLKYSNGVPDWAFESENSWVRFDFSGPPPSLANASAAPLWSGARQSLPQCTPTSLMSNDPSLHPPLSANELRFQCGDSSPLPCKLKWFPGGGCYKVVDASWTTGDGAVLKGYLARADALNYRVVAGVSGTTANVLQ